MAKKNAVTISLIIPDASPIITLARIDRLDLLGRFSVPIHIVDQVAYEIIKPENDGDGRIAAMMARLGNSLVVVETNVGVGYQTRRASNPDTPSRNLGEIAVDEYATVLAKTSGPSFVPLVLFEDPDVLQLRIAKLKNVHLINTTAWLMTLHLSGELPEAKDLIAKINATRKTPLDGFENRHERRSCAPICSNGITPMISDDLDGLSFSDVLELLEAGKIGHSAAMDAVNASTYNDLVRIMHFNGRQMPGHRPMIVAPETRDLLLSITRRRVA
jgi:hypothetical protein